MTNHINYFVDCYMQSVGTNYVGIARLHLVILGTKARCYFIDQFIIVIKFNYLGT